MTDAPTISYKVEITDANDPRQKTSLLSDSIDADNSPLPVPMVGEHIFAEGKYATVVSRLFCYYQDAVHIQLFCEEGRLTQKQLKDCIAKIEFMLES